MACSPSGVKLSRVIPINQPGSLAEITDCPIILLNRYISLCSSFQLAMLPPHHHHQVEFRRDSEGEMKVI